MEKIIVKIGTIGKCSTEAHCLNRSANEDIAWLKDTLEISYKRALQIYNKLLGEDVDYVTSHYIELAMNYQQLARYTAKRQVEGLNKYWKFPLVLEHIEHEEYEGSTPVEVRPNFRSAC